MNTTTSRGLRAISVKQPFSLSPRIQNFLLHFRHTSTNTPLASQKYSANGPATTRPPPLEEPVRKPGQGTLSHLISRGKAYASFYKTGVKYIYYNLKAVMPIHHMLESKFKNSIDAAISERAITRSDFQLLRRARHDLVRVPVFALVVLVCGELTPFIVLGISGIVPWTCRIPMQIEADRRKREKARTGIFHVIITRPPTEEGVEKLGAKQLVQINGSLGLSSEKWQWIGGLPVSILRKKVDKRLKYLKQDDELIRYAGGVGQMDIEEVRMALVERGVNVLNKEETHLRSDLMSWLMSREKKPAEMLLLIRPSAWPVRVETHVKAATEQRKILTC